MDTHTFTAFMEDPDADRPDNPIHSTAGGQQYGFTGALVGGIHVYGWASEAFVSTLGEQWLESGWVDVSFRRPVYNKDHLGVVLDGQTFRCTRLADNEDCLRGEAGLGQAPWLSLLSQTQFAEGTPADDTPKPALTLDNAPVGQSLHPLLVPAGRNRLTGFINSKQGSAHPRYTSDNAVLHPAWVAGLMIQLLHHSWQYGPAIHVRSQIQHLTLVPIPEQVSVTGCCTSAWDHKGHHTIQNDGSVWDTSTRQEIARIRHTAIFRVRQRETT